MESVNWSAIVATVFGLIGWCWALFQRWENRSKSGLVLSRTLENGLYKVRVKHFGPDPSMHVKAWAQHGVVQSGYRSRDGFERDRLADGESDGFRVYMDDKGRAVILIRSQRTVGARAVWPRRWDVVQSKYIRRLQPPKRVRLRGPVAQPDVLGRESAIPPPGRRG